MTEKLIFPLVHLNGSGKKNLIEGYVQTAHTVNEAIKKLCDITPHMRDYYPMENSEELFRQAREQHYNRIDRLREVQVELNALALGVPHPVTREITNYEDIIDSRDVIDRIDEIEDLLSEEVQPDDADDLKAELDSLKELAEQGQASPDWHWGEALIRDSHFEDYAQELAEDTGAIDRNASWPNTCIDWEQAASELQHDFISVEFDGVTYWIRA